MFFGMLPSKELDWRLRYWSLCRRPISCGIWPLKLLIVRLMSLRNERFAMWGGKEPTNPISPRFKATTRWGCRLLQVTPPHMQKWRESFQALKTPLGSSDIASLKGRRASRSISFMKSVADSANDYKKPWRRKDQNTPLMNRLVWKSSIVVALRL